MQIECCGPDDWVDYPAWNKVVPNECRNPATGNIMNEGCSQEFALFLTPKSSWLAGLALALVVIQVV